MQDYNKKNLEFLVGVFVLALLVFFTVVMLTYVGKDGLWSAILPVLAIGCQVYSGVKYCIKLKKESEIPKD